MSKKSTPSIPPVRRVGLPFLGLPTRFLLFFPPSFVLGVKFDMPHVTVLTLFLLLVPLFLKRPLSVRERPLIYSAVAVLVAAILPAYMIEIHPNRYAFFDLAVRSHITVPMFLYAGSFLCLFQREREHTGWIAGCSLFAMLLCGDLFFLKDSVNSRFPGTDWLLNHYTVLYTGTLVLVAAGLLLLLTSEARYNAVRTTSPRTARLLRLTRYAFILLVPLTAYFAHRLYFSNESFLKRWESLMMKHGRYRRTPGGEYFGNETRIDSPGAYRNPQTLNEILVRVKSPLPPGYLRAAVYSDYFANGMWRIPQNREFSRATDLMTEHDYDGLAISAYRVRFPDKEEQEVIDRNKGLTKIEFQLSERMRGERLPVPGNLLRIDLIGTGMTMTRDGELQPLEWQRGGGYIVQMPYNDFEGAYPGPGKPNRDNQLEHDRFRSFTHFPPHLWNMLTDYLLKIYPDGVPEEEVPPSAIADEICDYLRLNNTYSLDPRLLHSSVRNDRTGIDPVSRFLYRTRAGHCELFATAGTLLLRRAGIPARYVTGFVCKDQHPSGLFYYATGRNAHAWIEYYDSESGLWRLADPTPADFGESIAMNKRGNVRAFMDMLSYGFETAIEYLRRGEPVKLVFAALNFLLDALLWLVTSVIGWGLLFLMAIGVTLFIRRKHLRRRRDPCRHCRAAQKRVHSLERILSRRSEVFRLGHMSLRDWARDATARLSGADDLSRLLDCYEQLRFSPCRAAPRFAALEAELERLARQIQRSAVRKNAPD